MRRILSIFLMLAFALEVVAQTPSARNSIELDQQSEKKQQLDASHSQRYSIIVNTNREDADIYIDDAYRGKTNNEFYLLVHDVLPGDHTLRVECAGRISTMPITVHKESLFFRCNIQEPRPQFVLFGVEPKNATVVIDGRNFEPQEGLVALLLLNGVYRWSARANGYHEQNGTFTVEDSKVVYNVILQPISSSDSINSGTISAHNATKTYKVGDYYNENGKEGVVFWVDETGQHGKIVSLTESKSGLQWSSDTAEQKRLIGADDENDGANNMAKVMQIPDWQSKYPAFKWCADLGDGWYLPAIAELELFTLDKSVHNAVNKALAAKGIKLANKGVRCWYWSSTEHKSQYYGEFCAWLVDMYSGNTSYNFKFDDYYVRAVSAF